MQFYSEEIIEEVRSRTNIVDVVGRYVDLKKKGASYFGLCPFHNEKTGSFSVSPSKQIFYCFGCGEGGNAISFLMKYDNLTFTEALKQLADECGVKLPEREPTAEEKRVASRRERIMAANKDAATYYYSLLRSERGKRAMDYFTGRKLSQETMQKFGLGYSDASGNGLYNFLKDKGYDDDILSDTGLINMDEKRGGRDKFWNRAMFPIMDGSSRVIAFGGRVMGDGDPKYLNSRETPVFDKSRTLYGLHLARRSRREGFILCEGYMDVIALHQAGFDNAVASLGTSLTEGHARLISRFTHEVFLSYDSDGAGVKAALRAIPILKDAGVMARIVHMDPYKDPDEFIKALGADEYEKRLADAENSFLFSLSVVEKTHERSDPESWTAFQNHVAERLLEFSEELERENYLQAACKRFDIPVAAMQRQVARRAAEGFTRKSGAPPQDEAVQNKKIRPRDDGLIRAQMLLLQWVCDLPGLYGSIRDYLDTSDFDDGVMQSIAQSVMTALDNGEKIDPASLIDQYPEDEDKNLIARLFNEEVGGMEDEAKRTKAVKEALIRVKKNAIQKRIGELEPTDPEIFKLQMEGRTLQKKIESLSI